MYIYRGTLSKAKLQELQQAAQGVDLQPGPGGSGMSEIVSTMQHMVPTIGTVLSLRGVLQQARLVGLWPSQQIAKHCDAPLAPGVVRYHLPLQTNDGCWSYAGGVWAQLGAGEIYRLDPTEEHGAVNWGSEIRVHLMIDVKEG